MEKSSQRKTALITGGSGNIGKAIITALADLNFDIIFQYNKSLKAANELKFFLKNRNLRFLAVKADFNNDAQTQMLIQTIKDNFNALDVIIHNAGGHEKKDFRFVSEKDYQSVFSVNVKTPLFLTQKLYPLLLKSQTPKMIFIGSTHSFSGGDIKNVLYTSSKGALIGLTRNLAKSFAPNVLVNCIVPGYINTPGFFKKRSAKEIVKKIDSILLKKLGNPEDIAKAVAFLVSNGGDYINGQAIHIDGGLYFG